MTHEERKKRQREYNKRHYEKNYDRERLRSAKYRQNNPDAHKAATMAWRARNEDRFLKMRRDWRTANVEARRQYRKAYRQENVEAVAASERAYRQNNPDKMQALRKRRLIEQPEQNRFARSIRRAREKQAFPEWADHKIMRAIYREAARLTKETGIAHDVDHIVPLAGKNVCGLHWEGNLRIVTAAENREKSNRFLPELVEGASRA